MRDFRFFHRPPFIRSSFLKCGVSDVPFTLERRYYVYVGPWGCEWWAGEQKVRPGIFEDK